MTETSRTRSFGLTRVLVIITLVFLTGLAVGTAAQYWGTNHPIQTQSTLTSGRLYDVTFYQGPTCGSSWITKWGVTLGNHTILEPSNITLSQIDENGFLSTSKFNLTKIVFSLAPGSYNFTLYPTAWLRVGGADGEVTGHSTGVVNITNSDLTIYADSVGICTGG